MRVSIWPLFPPLDFEAIGSVSVRQRDAWLSLGMMGYGLSLRCCIFHVLMSLHSPFVDRDASAVCYCYFPELPYNIKPLGPGSQKEWEARAQRSLLQLTLIASIGNSQTDCIVTIWALIVIDNNIGVRGGWDKGAVWSKNQFSRQKWLDRLIPYLIPIPMNSHTLSHRFQKQTLDYGCASRWLESLQCDVSQNALVRDHMTARGVSKKRACCLQIERRPPEERKKKPITRVPPHPTPPSSYPIIWHGVCDKAKTS